MASRVRLPAARELAARRLRLLGHLRRPFPHEALRQARQGHQPAPVDREYPRHQHRTARQHGQRNGKDHPSGSTARKPRRDRLGCGCADQTGKAARTCGERHGHVREGERQDHRQQRHREEQQGERAPPARMRGRVRFLVRGAPQASRTDVEQRQHQHADPAEGKQRAFCRPGPGIAHPVGNGPRGSSSGRWAGIGLRIADQR